MNDAREKPADSPEFNYHLLRNALSLFGKNLAQLAGTEYRQVHDQAT